jgi:hypothetical protein
MSASPTIRPAAVGGRTEQIKNEIEKTTSDYDKEKFE